MVFTESASSPEPLGIPPGRASSSNCTSVLLVTLGASSRKLMALPRSSVALSLSPSPSVRVAVRLIRSPLSRLATWSGPLSGE
ncbi:hypothetical protein D3C76_1057740 [compost metagenome]